MSISRHDTGHPRDWVHACLRALLAAGVLTAGQATPARAAQASGEVFEVVELARGVHAALVRDDSPVYAFANSLVLTGSRGILVVDTQQSPTAARALLDWIRAHLAAPVRWVVNTHAHSDHTYGNEVYRDAFPGVVIVAHESVRRFMLETARSGWRKSYASSRRPLPIGAAGSRRGRGTMERR